jgi:hypothetical protein
MTKQFLYISLLILISFSCKKERLTGNDKLLVGEWRLSKSIHSYSITGGCHSTQKTDSECKPTTIIFKKNGEITLSDSTGNYNYSILSSGPTRALSNEYKLLGCRTSYIDSISGYHKMEPTIYYKDLDREFNPHFYFNNSNLVIESNDVSIFDDYNISYSQTTYHFFEKIN